MSTQNLRFAGLVRVSTERQEEQGDSLRTQRADIIRAVANLKGTIVAWYGGQEHATEGWERKELDRLLADVSNRSFDAFMVAYADRWSRDNRRSEEGLEIFCQNGVRFFVGTTEKNLFDPQHRFELSIHSSVGAYIAALQTKKSMEVKIERAKRGYPSCGHSPYRRIFDRETEKWSIDPDKQKLVIDLASRYLAGDTTLEELAKIAGMCRSVLWETLMHRCGPEWVQEFRCKKLAIHARVATTIPALLPEETITKIHQQAAANKTFSHGHLKNKYLLSRMVFCAGCGTAMCASTPVGGHSQYVHIVRSRVKEPCPCRVHYVKADVLEKAVLCELFHLFGNPAAMERAFQQAIPNPAQIDVSRQRLHHVSKELEGVTSARDRIIRAIARGSITEDQADKQLGELKEREALLQGESKTLSQELSLTLSPQEIKDAAERVTSSFKKVNHAKLWATELTINSDLPGMLYEDQRTLMEMVFSGTTPDGKRMGVYVYPAEGKRGRRCWPFRIVGRLVDLEHCWTLDSDSDPDTDELHGGTLQRDLLKEVKSQRQTKFVSPSHPKP